MLLEVSFALLEVGFMMFKARVLLAIIIYYQNVLMRSPLVAILYDFFSFSVSQSRLDQCLDLSSNSSLVKEPTYSQSGKQ